MASVTRLGDFRMFWETIFQKIAKIFSDIFVWAIVKNDIFRIPAVDSFWANFGKTGLLFSRTTGHTVCDSDRWLESGSV